MKKNALICIASVTFLFCAVFILQTPSYGADESKLKDLPMDKAIRIGMGKNTVIEFTDPDCPYCRKLDDYMQKRKDVTRYIFLFPLTQLHPKSEEKAKSILCSSDQSGTFEDVMTGHYDKEPVKPCKDAKSDGASSATLKEFHEIGQKLGISGTPALFVNGNFINGANIPAIEQLIGPLR